MNKKLVPGYLNSATKTVLILMILATITFVGFGIEIPQEFWVILGVVCAFYFGQKTVEDTTIS